MSKTFVQSPARRLTTGLAASVTGLALLTFPTSLRAADVYWNNTSLDWNTSTATWNTAADNSGTTQAWVDGDSAIFTTSTVTSGSYTLTNGGVTVDNITQNASRIRISSGTITLADTSATYDVQTRVSGDYDLRIDSVIADSTGGASSITKNGAGMLLLVGTNTYSGGFTLNAGTVNFESSAGIFGTGTVTLNGGTLAKSWGNGSNVSFTNALNVTGTTNLAIVQGAKGDFTLSGVITGSGTLQEANTAVGGLGVVNATIYISQAADISGFTGTFAQTTGSNRLRFGTNATDSTLTTFDASNSKFLTSGSTSSGNGIDLGDGRYGTFKMGELAGTGGRIQAGWASNGNTTFEVGALNTHSKFAGIIAENVRGSGGHAALNKVGTGTLELAKLDGQTYTAGTTVSDGRLLVSNTSGSGTGTAAVTVDAGAILGGSGIITPTGANAISVSGILAPGGSVSATTGGSFSNSVGTLTFNLGSTTAGMTLNSGATLSFDLGASFTADKISIVSGTAGDLVFNSNTINFNNLSGGALPEGTYTLFSADAAVYSGLTLDGSSHITAGLNIGSGLSGFGASYLQLVGNDITLVVAVPEPHQFAFAIVGLLGVMVFARRRSRSA